jgi:predicted alpha/beta-fold hydrolase
VLPGPRPAGWEREIVELPEGDFVEAHWALPRLPGTPVVVILHGLEGSSGSPYAGRLAAACADLGWQSVVLHARGCGDRPNRLPRGYHAGETADVAVFLDWLAGTGHGRVAAVGYSLGGNVLVKYLGEHREHAGVVAAVAVSVPYDLADSASAVDRGLARVYRARLLGLMKQRLRQGIETGRLDERWTPALAAGDFRSFDDLFTAPVHGFSGVDDYYRRCSGGAFVAGIRKPTLLIHARDDPFMTAAALPDRTQLPPGVRLEAFASGGHVGFISGGTPWRPRWWLEPRITDFLAPLLDPGLEG